MHVVRHWRGKPPLTSAVRFSEAFQKCGCIVDQLDMYFASYPSFVGSFLRGGKTGLWPHAVPAIMRLRDNL